MAIPPVVVDFRVQGVAMAARAFATVADASQRAEVARTKAAEKATKERERIEARAQKEKERQFAQLSKDADKWQRQDVIAAERAEKEKLRAAERQARMYERIRENSATMAGRLAEKQANAEIREAKRVHDARVRFLRATGSAGYNSAAGIVSGAVSMAGTALALGGGFSIAGAVRSEGAAQRQAAQLVNAVTANGTAPEGATVQNILAKTAGMSNATGMSREEIIAGGLAYARSARGGNFSGIIGDKGNLEFFAKLAKTTGTSIEDIGQAAGTLQSQNADLGKNPALMRQMLLNAYAQSKSGSVSLTEAAKQFGTLGSTRGFFQGDEAKNQQTLIGLGQIAAAGGESGDIGTYIKDVSMEAAAHRHSTATHRGLESMGVKFDKQGRMESPEQMIGAVFKATGGDLGKISEIFGKRGMPLFSELQKSFLTAGGGDKGVAAVMSQIHGVTGSTMSEEDLNKQFAQTMSTSAERFDLAVTKVQNILMDKLAPRMEQFADKLPEWLPKIEKAIDAVDKFADWFLDNPLLHSGEIIAAKITADIARAAIGNAVKQAILSAMAGGGGGSAASTVASAAGGGAGGSKLGKNLATAGAIAAIAVASEQTGEGMIDSALHGKMKGQGKVQSLITQVKTGQISPEKAQALMDQAKAQSGIMSSVAGSQLTGMGAIIGGVTGNKDNFATRAAQKQQEDNAIATSKELAQAIKDMTAALKAHPVHEKNDPRRTVSMADPSRGGVQ